MRSDWIIQRVGLGSAVETALGLVPDRAGLNLQGIGITPATVDALLEVPAKDWLAELASIREYLESYGDRTPAALLEQLRRVTAELS
jgi:phosphoenolpyruvate carboxykinase (GTP)